MSRRALHITALVLWLALFGALGLIGAHGALIWLLLAGALGYVLTAFRTRCASCGAPLLLRPLRLFGVELYLWSLLPPAQCRHCGKPAEK